MPTTVRPSAACEAIARVLRTAGLHSVSEHFSPETGHIVLVGNAHDDGAYHAVPTGRGDIRVRWIPDGGNIMSLGTVDRPERVAGLILDHIHNLI